MRRSDTNEIEGFLTSDIKPKPEADVRISIGKPYENVQDERRVATEAFALDLRETVGVTVDLEVIDREQGVYGLGPVEWTAIFVGTTVATVVITNLTNDLYAKAKQLLIDRRAKGRNRAMGFVIYGPEGEELRRWATNDDDDDQRNEAD